MITVALPFMTVDMVQGSLLKLLKKGIIKTAVFNEDKFDHTNWYTFTDYGIEMMDPGIIIAGGTGEMYSFREHGLMDQIYRSARSEINER